MKAVILSWLVLIFGIGCAGMPLTEGVQLMIDEQKAKTYTHQYNDLEVGFNVLCFAILFI